MPEAVDAGELKGLHRGEAVALHPAFARKVEMLVERKEAAHLRHVDSVAVGEPQKPVHGKLLEQVVSLRVPRHRTHVGIEATVDLPKSLLPDVEPP